MGWYPDHWEKNIDIDLINDGRLYEIPAMGRPHAMNDHSNDIDAIIDSVKFGLSTPVP